MRAARVGVRGCGLPPSGYSSVAWDHAIHSLYLCDLYRTTAQGNHVVGILGDDVDPAVNVMKVEHAPSESYADVGGLEQQIQEIKEAVELPLTHPELYEDIGIKPPKVRVLSDGDGGGEGEVGGKVRGGLSMSENVGEGGGACTFLFPPSHLHATLFPLHSHSSAASWR